MYYIYVYIKYVNIINIYIKRYNLKIIKTEDPSHDMKRQRPSKDAGEFTFCWTSTAVHTVFP